MAQNELIQAYNSDIEYYLIPDIAYTYPFTLPEFYQYISKHPQDFIKTTMWLGRASISARNKCIYYDKVIEANPEYIPAYWHKFMELTHESHFKEKEKLIPFLEKNRSSIPHLEYKKFCREAYVLYDFLENYKEWYRYYNKLYNFNNNYHPPWTQTSIITLKDFIEIHETEDPGFFNEKDPYLPYIIKAIQLKAKYEKELKKLKNIWNEIKYIPGSKSYEQANGRFTIAIESHEERL